MIHVIVANLGWDQEHTKYRRHRIAEHLLKQNETDKVIWVYPVSASIRKPSSLSKSFRITKSNPYLNKHNIIEWALPDYLPGRFMKYENSFNNRQFIDLKRYLKQYNTHKVLWFTYPFFPFLLDMLDWDAVVYDCSDFWQKPSSGVKSKIFSSLFAESLITSAEKRITVRSNLVFASSDYLADKLHKVSGKRVIVVENGVDLVFLSDKVRYNEDPLLVVPKPRLGYVGVMRGKNDFEMLDCLAKARPEWSLVLIGPNHLTDHTLFEKLCAKTNVYWTGHIDTDRLPAYIRSLDVGLLPYKEIEYNKAVFPLKFYEYLSQGIPIVGCGLPSTKKYAEEGIYIHGNKENYQQACETALKWVEGGDINYTTKRIKMAKEANWDSKLSYMYELVMNSLRL